MDKYNIIYCSNMCTEEKYRSLFEKAGFMPGQQVQKYHRTFLKGLIRNGNFNVAAVSKQPLSRKISSRVFFKKDVEKYETTNIIYLPFVNLPILNNLPQYFFVKKEIKKLARIGYNCVLIDVLNVSMDYAVATACRKYGLKLIGIVTDLPQFLTNKEDSFSVKMGNRVISKCDGYVLLTEQMNDIINKDRSKPFVVIEGQIDDDVHSELGEEKKLNDKKICLYSGSLDEANGIRYMTEGFLKANIPGTELHIYGDGDYREKLEKVCLENKTVIYHGTRLNEEVVEAQKNADLLINPRPTDQEFVKYSFPSKNMEYMASGTPLLTTELPGMPEEYKEYVYLIKDESVDGMSEILKNVFLENADKRNIKGLDAQRFVIENKTGSKQVNKIVDLIKQFC